MESGAGNRRVPGIEGFTDLELIGRGGFSVVYAATQTALHRRVAVKVFQSDSDDGRRLEREIRALGALADVPHIVPAHAVVTTLDGEPAMVMPLMRESLAERIRRDGPQPVQRVNRWGAELAACVDLVHARGVVHRDIKPENVLLDESGAAYLADFGIAGLESLASNTVTVSSISPPHAAPERLRGDESQPILGDVYSLASTLYFAVAGRAPFGTTADGGAQGLVERIVHAPVPADPSIPSAVLVVLQQAMAKEASHRFATARQFALALEASQSATIDEPTLERSELKAGAVFGSLSGRAPKIDPPVEATRARPVAVTGLSNGLSATVEPPVETARDDKQSAAEDPSGTGPRRRGVAFLAVMSVSLAALVAAGALLAVQGQSPPPLDVSIVDETTDENPLPDEFVVTVAGRARVLGLGASMSFRDEEAFDSADEVELTINVPDPAVLNVTRAGRLDPDGVRAIHIFVRDSELRASKNMVAGETSGRRLARRNPVAEARRAEREASREARQVERARVREEIRRIEEPVDAIAAQVYSVVGQPGDLIGQFYDGVNKDLLPAYEMGISQLASLRSTDQLSTEAIDATGRCFAGQVEVLRGLDVNGIDEAASMCATADEKVVQLTR